MRTILIFTLVISLLASCQEPTTQDKLKAESKVLPTSIDGHPVTAEDRIAKPGETIRSSYNRDYSSKRGTALSIMDHRISNDDEKFYSIIEDGIWEYAFIHNGEGMSKLGAHDGEWLDFKQDNTYAKGKGKTVTSKGKYHYLFSKDTVLMIPDDTKANPEEWKTIFGSDMVMILVGTAEYGNNNFQMKLERRKTLDEINE